MFAGADEIGKVTAVREYDFEVARGMLFRHVYVIPARYVAEAGGGVVDLKLDKDAVDRLEAVPTSPNDLPEEYRRSEFGDDRSRPDDPTDLLFRP